MEPIDTPLALLISNDSTFTTQLENELGCRFDIQIQSMSESKLRESFYEKNPLFVIWDVRSHLGNDFHFISWLRDHFNGKPIIAVDQGEVETKQDGLHRNGIHILLDMDSPTFFNSLQVHIFAILLDCEKKKSKSLSNSA